VQLNVQVNLFFNILPKIIECADEFCGKCSSPGINSCEACVADSYLDDKTNTCTHCDPGYFAPVASTSVDQCQSKFLIEIIMLILN